MADLMLLSLYRQQNELAKVEAVCQRLLAKPSVFSIPAIAEVYASQGELDQANRVLGLLDGMKTQPAARELILADYSVKYRSPESAQALYRRATEVAPDNPATWRALTTFYLASGQGSNAVDAVRQGLKSVKDDPNLNAISAYSDQLADAVVDPQLRPIAVAFAVSVRANGQESDAACARQTLDTVLNDRQQRVTPDRMIRELVPVADHYPRFLPLQIYLAQAEVGMGELDIAAQFAGRAAVISPGSSDPYRLLTSILMRSRRWAEVIDAATKWRDRSLIKTAEPDVAIANAYLNMQQPAAAMKQLDEYMDQAKVAPGMYAQILALYARSAQLAGRSGIAEILEPLLQEGADGQRVWMLFAAQNLPPDQAAAWLDRATKLISANDIDTQTCLSQMWLMLSTRTGNVYFADNARSIITSLVSRPNPSAGLLTALGIQCEHDNDLAGAEEAYRRSLKLLPNSPITLNNLAMVLAKRGGDLEEARSFVNEALELMPNTAAFYDTSAFIESKQLRYDEAVAQMREGVHRDPDNARYILNLAQYLAADGEPEEASDMLSRFNLIAKDQVLVSADLRQQAELVRLAIAKLTKTPHAS